MLRLDEEDSHERFSRGAVVNLRRVLVPLALAQFICSFAGSNMNVMINDISADLNTTVQGVQITITIFLLVMAALMVPGGKLTDRYGRKRMFTAGLASTASARC
jgi:MFS family permease